MNRPARRYEEAAEIRTDLTGWCYKHCNKYWGDNESGARRCCSDDRPCHMDGCDRRVYGKTPSFLCDSCTEKVRIAKWEAKPKVPWDGETPLAEWWGDRYFFGFEDVVDYIEDVLDEGGSIGDIRLVLARKLDPPTFSMEEYCFDYRPEDGPDFPDATEINRAVNEWMNKNLDSLWEATGTCIDPGSLPVPQHFDSDLDDDATPDREESA